MEDSCNLQGQISYWDLFSSYIGTHEFLDDTICILLRMPRVNATSVSLIQAVLAYDVSH